MGGKYITEVEIIFRRNFRFFIYYTSMVATVRLALILILQSGDIAYKQSL